MSTESIQLVLGEALLEGLKDPVGGRSADLFGCRVLDAVRGFVHRDLPCGSCLDRELFNFIDDVDLRSEVLDAFCSARWQAKVGLLLERDPTSSYHRSHVRAQIVEFGGIIEAAITSLLAQTGNSVEGRFDELIDRTKPAGLLTDGLRVSAHDLRKERNRVHLDVSAEQSGPSNQRQIAENQGKRFYIAVVKVLNGCRADLGLGAWDTETSCRCSS